MKTVVSVFILIFIIFGGSHVEARTPRPLLPTQPKKEKFTPQEKEFLAAIAIEAQEIVSESLERTQFQLDQITNNSKLKPQILSAVKSAYAQYKTYLVLSHNGNYNYAVDVGYPMRDYTVSLTGDYSPYDVQIFAHNRKQLEKMREDDDIFFKRNRERCRLNNKSMRNHYKLQLGSILTQVPVVLQIETNQDVPTDKEVIDAYQELLHNMQLTYEQFENYDHNEIEGLWGYQGIAQELVYENPELESIYESLRIKIEPQGFLEKTLAYIKGLLPAIGPLACTIAAIATVNPALAIICGAVNLYMAVNNLRNDYVTIEKKRREWLSGVSPYQDIERARKQLLVDKILLGFNIWAGATILRTTNYSLIMDLQFHKKNVISTLDIDLMRHQATKYAKKLRDGEIEGQAKNHLALGVGSLNRPDHIDVEQLSQATTDILLSYLRKGVFSFKDTAAVICQEQRNPTYGK